MYASQGLVPQASGGSVMQQEKTPSVVIRDINDTHADFILENCDMRYVSYRAHEYSNMSALQMRYVVQSLPMCPQLVCMPYLRESD